MIIIMYISVFRCMPWLCLEKNHVFCSEGQSLFRFNRTYYGGVSKSNYVRTLPHGAKDVSKFVVTDNEVISAGRYFMLLLLIFISENL